jgi:EKC/KEOPS complex subunit PCC1/LAGE3
MLRVAVNGFFESMGVVLGVMEELGVDVLGLPEKEGLEGVQGVEKIPG